MKYLFVLGPKDGEWREIDVSLLIVEVLEVVDSRPIGELLSSPGLSVQMQKVYYKRMPFRGNSKDFFVYAYELATADDVIEALIRFYAPNG